MNESKHTPGPWYHNPADEPQNAERHVCVDEGRWLRVIARVKQNDKDNALANARLIATAPDLLEALEKIMVAVDTDSVKMPPSLGMMASSAIRKARREVIKRDY